MIDNNIRVFSQQKEFAQNASHELQTPLAILKSKIDLLIQDTSLTVQQRQLIETLDNSISRMTRINKNLLLLAAMEKKDYAVENIHLSPLLSSLITGFCDVAENKNCSIRINIEDGIAINGNESLVEIMITNLLSNAVRHSTDNCKISITLNKKELIVTNNGIASLSKNSLFKRFISATSQTPGTGLGLAIVKEICDKYNWKVSYDHQEGNHIFSVSF
jgi:signal transduction histidine kinase